MAKNIGSMKAKVSLDGSDFRKGMDSLRRSARSFGKDMKAVGRNMSLAISAPLAAFGALSLKTAGDFEASMNKVAAVSGATEGQLDMLRKSAEKMGRETQFSASEAADALGFLAMAGFDANEAVSALPHTLTLAASAGMDLASSADIVSNVLSGYGLAVEDLARVNDVLVATITSSNTNLEQMGEAMAQAGPIAASAGMSFEEASAAIGMFGNAGIQGSIAGTTLKNAIAKMLAPTDAVKKKMEDLGLVFTDASGRLLPFDNIIQQLAPHASDTALMLELFGQRAGPGMAALVSQGAGALRELTHELENSTGEAARIAAAQMEGFNGALKELKSAFEALQISIGNSGFLAFAEGMVDKLKNLLLKISEVNPKILKFGTIVAGIAVIVGPIVVALGVLSAAIAAISLPVLAVVAGIAALGTAAVVLTGALGDTSDAANVTTAAELALKAALSEVNTSSAESVQAGRAVAEQHQKQAQAAIIAARAELALAQATAEKATADMMSSGEGSLSFMNNVVGQSAEGATSRFMDPFKADLAEAEAGLAGIEAQILGLDVAAALIAAPSSAASGSGDAPVISETTEETSALTAEVNRLLASLDPTIAAEQRMTEATTLLDQSLAAGVITQEEYNTALAQLSEQVNGAGGGTGGLARMAEAATTAKDKIAELAAETASLAKDIGGTVGNAFSGMFDSLLNGTFDARDALRGLAADLAKMAMNAVFKSLLSSFGGGGGFLSGLLGGLSGARAAGGPVIAGNSYLTGEKGIEIFTPNVSGNITPNSALGSLASAPPAPSMSTKIVNVFDPAIVGDYLATIDGERLLMNLMQRNQPA